jgi:DNA-directed RNA polymerase specialized sigma24 family protein
MIRRHESRELRRLRRAHASMPAQARAVFDLHRFDDKPYEVIAAELGIGVAEVERRMADAMCHLMQACDEPEPGAVARFGAWLRAAFGRVWRR